jgi:hypothetical protein
VSTAWAMSWSRQPASAFSNTRAGELPRRVGSATQHLLQRRTLFIRQGNKGLFRRHGWFLLARV